MKSENIHIILCHPFSADNIGAVMRAMKNMGFSKLRLVAPRRNWKRRAKVLARSASNLLDVCETYPTLGEAVADLNLTFGTTRRTHNKRSKFVDFDGFIPTVVKRSRHFKIGLVFGREAKGLTIEEIDCCDQLVSIPADKAYPSLNLAQAVMVTLFSLTQKQALTSKKSTQPAASAEFFLNKADTQSALNHFAKALKWIGFYEGKDGRLDKIKRIMEGLFKRAGMFEYEAQTLKGISARIIQRASSAAPSSK